MLNKNMETFLCCDSDYEEAGVVLFGAPFDSTTSYRRYALWQCRYSPGILWTGKFQPVSGTGFTELPYFR